MGILYQKVIGLDKMQGLHTKSNATSSKGWLTSAKIAKSKRKTAVRLICCHLYNYCSNNPVRYIDPDGKKETNADDTYMVARLENPVYIPKLDENGNVIYSYDIFGGFEFEEIDTVIIKPHTSIDGKYDGTRNVNGDYSKYAGKSWLPEVDCIVYSDHIEITNALGKIVSCLGDTPEGKNGDSLIFKLHKKARKKLWNFLINGMKQ